MEDYAVIMAILNRNLSEGADEFPPVEEPERPQTPKLQDIRLQESKVDVESATGSNTAKRKVAAVVSATGTPQKSTVHVQMKFNFLFDGVVINLLLSKCANRKKKVINCNIYIFRTFFYAKTTKRA